MLTITSGAEIARHDDEVVHVAGVYAVQDLGRYRIVSRLADGTELQSNKASYLMLDDGAIVHLGARPEGEHGLAGRRVIATGRLRASWPPPPDPPQAAAPRPKPTLLEIAEVKPTS